MPKPKIENSLKIQSKSFLSCKYFISFDIQAFEFYIHQILWLFGTVLSSIWVQKEHHRDVQTSLAGKSGTEYSAIRCTLHSNELLSSLHRHHANPLLCLHINEPISSLRDGEAAHKIIHQLPPFSPSSCRSTRSFPRTPAPLHLRWKGFIWKWKS